MQQTEIETPPGSLLPEEQLARGEECSKFCRSTRFFMGAIVVCSSIASLGIVFAINLNDPESQLFDCWPGTVAAPLPIIVRQPDPAPAAQVYASDCKSHPRCGQLEGQCCPTEAGVLSACCDSISSSTPLEPFLGLCYTSLPAKDKHVFHTDDCMAGWAKPAWNAQPGRDDLGIIRSLNATLVRTYGNDPRSNHLDFLNRAAQLGLGVMAGMSDFPYIDDPNNPCARAPSYDCYSSIKAQYAQMLRNGFSIEVNGSRFYHPALKAIVIFNEPELKVRYNNSAKRESRSKGFYTKVLVSALDGALDAEKELQILPSDGGRMPAFVVAYSTDFCSNCLSSQNGNVAGDVPIGQTPSLPFFYDFATAMLSPKLFGYGSHNDLRAALQNRCAFAFNTDIEAAALCSTVVEPLGKSPLAGLPLIVGEYKAANQSRFTDGMSGFENDLVNMRSYVEGTASCSGKGKPLRGFSIFEFQVSYTKTWSIQHERNFGIFELGSSKQGGTCKSFETEGETYPVWCLHAKRNFEGKTWVTSVAKVYGGLDFNDSTCPVDSSDGLSMGEVRRLRPI